MSDLTSLYQAEDEIKRWTAERENAVARLELAQIKRNAAYLISQHQPVAQSGINREMLRCFLSFLAHGNLTRLESSIQSAKDAANDK